MTTATFVLVHGAWHGAWCWQPLGAVLEGRGVAHDALDLPSSSGLDASVDMNADVLALRRFCHDRGPVVLVAHSYAGAVVAEAAPKIEGLAGIVYLAALVPRVGQTASDVTREYGLRSALDATIRRDDVGFLHLDPEPASLALYGDCDAATRQWAINKVSPQTFASFRTVRTSENIAVASAYVVCTRDQSLVPDVQEQVALRCDEVVRMDSDHSAFLSHPDKVADLFESLNFRA